MVIVGSRDADLRIKDYWFAIPSCGAITDYSRYVDEQQAAFFIIEKEPCTILACQKRGIRGRIPQGGSEYGRFRNNHDFTAPEPDLSP